jgi:N-acetylmuramoyl-L-alanine amidase
MSKKTICLSAGHVPGRDPGAVSGHLKEADLNVKIVRQAAQLLRDHKVPVLEVPDNLDLRQTIYWINQRNKQIDIAVEVHINAGGGTGVEAWHYHNSATSQKLAQFVVDGLAVESQLPNRGVKDEATNKWGRLGFVHDTKPLACLVECGFIDSSRDREVLDNDEGLFMFSKGLCRGLLGYMGKKWKPPLPPEDDPIVIAPAPIDNDKITKRVERLEVENEKTQKSLTIYSERVLTNKEEIKKTEEKLTQRVKEIEEKLSKIKKVL